MSYLEEIWLLENKIENIPSTSCKLSKLKYLNLSLNNLKEIPECLTEIDSLKHLILDSETEHSDYIKLQIARMKKQNSKIRIEM